MGKFPLCPTYPAAIIKAGKTGIATFSESPDRIFRPLPLLIAFVTETDTSQPDNLTCGRYERNTEASRNENRDFCWTAFDSTWPTTERRPLERKGQIKIHRTPPTEWRSPEALLKFSADSRIDCLKLRLMLNFIGEMRLCAHLRGPFNNVLAHVQTYTYWCCVPFQIGFRNKRTVEVEYSMEKREFKRRGVYKDIWKCEAHIYV